MQSLPIPRMLWAGALVVAALALPGDQACRAHEPAQVNSAAKIAELIRRLGDTDFQVREKAAAELLKQGEVARKQLQQAARDANDAEIRTRAPMIVKQLDELRRKASGVHVVGLYEASSRQHFRLVAPFGRDTDWARLCATLVEQAKKDAPSPGKRVWDLLTQEARLIVADKDQVNRINAMVQNVRAAPGDPNAMGALSKITQALEKALRRPDFYEEKSFRGVALDDETKLLLKRQPPLSLLELWVVNRRLLEASFPEAVMRSAFSLEKATVPIRVAATKEPITLVLCSYETVRWQIQADKGAKIEKVIVGGYHLQDVTGIDAPILYRVYERREGTTKEPSYFYAYMQDHENYPKLVDALQKLTGKEISTFQGRYSYEGGPPITVGVKD